VGSLVQLEVLAALKLTPTRTAIPSWKCLSIAAFAVFFVLSPLLANSFAQSSAPFQVTSFQPTHSGFVVEFNRPVDPTTLNLYDTETGGLGPSDVTVTGATKGQVVGSLVVNPSGITFIKTGGPLDPDSYTVTLRSAANGFKAVDGTLLNGSDGIAGHNYIAQFTMPLFTGPTASIPDFTYGPGQVVNVPFDRVGLPITLTDGTAVTRVDFTLVYDPTLLRVNAVAPGDNLPPDGTITVGAPQAGILSVTISTSVGFGAGPVEIVRLGAEVPITAPYRAVESLYFNSISLNQGTIPVTPDDGVHIVAYLGDTTGNAGYSSLDAQRVLRVATRLDTGFAAYPTVDPVLVGDITGNKAISALDATRILQKVAGMDRPEFPPLPTPPVADAGNDINALTLNATSLDGSTSYDPNGDFITFRWTLVQKPSASIAILAASLQPNPQFTPDLPGDYVFELIVNDGNADSLPDRVTVHAFAANAPPNARAGRDQNARVGTAVILDGSGSFSVTPANLGFSWSFASLPTGSALTDNSIVSRSTFSPSFTPDLVGTYALRLRVSNGALTDDDTVLITAAIPNVAPNASAALDNISVAVVNTAVELDGSQSFDPDAGPSPLSYSWSFVSRPSGSGLTNLHIADARTATPMFIPDVAGPYILRLKVSDGDKSATDNVLINVTVPVNHPPIARDDTVTTTQDAPVNINVSANDSDPDGDPLTIASVTQATNGKVGINPNNTVTYIPSSGFTGSDTFTYTISDGRGGTASATVGVTINPPLTIVTNSLASGTVNEAYTPQTLTASGGTPPYTWNIAYGSLPPGLTLFPSGRLSGTPTTEGTSAFSVQVRDNALRTGTQSLNLRINAQSLPVSVSGMAGYWSFDDGTASDNSGNGNNGTLINDPTPVPGKAGRGLSFDGITQYVNVGDVLDPGSGDLSVFAWVRSTQSGGLNMIVSKRNSSAAANPGYQLFQNLNGALTFTFADGRSSRVRIDSTGPLINDGNWHLVGVVYTRTANGVLYVDGVPATGGSGSITSQSGAVDNSVPLRFGLEDSTDSGFHWNGALDEVRIYNRALSAQEVADMYPLTIVSTTVPDGMGSTPYNQSLTALGGTPPYSWSVASGSLPQGLSLSQSGMISGTPTGGWTSTFSVRVQDSALRTATQSFSLTIILPVSTSGLVGYWSFDDGTATDNSGRGNNGTLINNPASVVGKSGKALSLNGTSQYIDAGNVLDPGSGDLSVLAWVKTTQGGALNMIVSKRNSSVGTNAGYQVFQNFSGAISFAFGNGQFFRARVDSTAPRINDGNWHLVGVVFTRTGNGVIYVDGAPATGGSGSIVSQSGSVSNSVPLRFGLEDGAEPAFYWNGAIDEVRVYNRALSAQEIADMYPLTISTALTAATIGGPYNESLTASGGTSPYTWTLASGSLPPGLSLSESGTISGVPTTAGTFTFSVQVRDNAFATATQSLNLTIAVFSDTFSGNLANWTVVDEGTNEGPSEWVISNGEVIQRSNIWGGNDFGNDPVRPGTYIYYAGNASWQDYSFSVRLMSEDNDAIGAMFRFQDSRNYYRFSMDSQDGYRRLVKVVNGVTTVLAEDAFRYVTGQWYTLRVSLVGKSIRIYLNQTLIFVVVDDSISAGKIALYSWGNQGSHFDDVVVNDSGTFYLATNGDDNNPGTEQLPFKTLRRAVLEMKSGDRLIIRQGEYRAGNTLMDSSGNGKSIIPSGIDESHRTTFQAYPGETVVWRTYMPDNSPVDEITFRNGFKIFRQPDCINKYGGDGGWPISCPSSDDITLPYFQQVGFSWLEWVLPLLDPISYIDFDGITFDGRGISAAAIGIVSASHVRFMNGEIRNTVKSCVNTPIGTDDPPPAYLEFINMKIHDCGIPYDPEGRNDPKARFWHGAYIQLGSVTFDRVEFYSNAGNGPSLGGGNTFQDNNVIRNSIIHDHYNQGIAISSGNGHLIENNLLYNNSTGIHLLSWDQIGTRISNNTIIGTGVGIHLNHTNQSQLIENNIITGVIQGVVMDNPGPNTLRNNLIYPSLGSSVTPFISFGADPILQNNLFGSSYDAKFINPAAHDFRLQAGSSAINAGYPNGLASDLDGCARSAGAGIDIGAYEYAPTCNSR
jgi:hypothetical protein